MKVPYTFRDPSLLTLALTHASLAVETGGVHNQRLEFLGDSVVQLLVTEWLYAARPGWDEGALTRARAALVSTQSFATFADRWELGPSLRVGRGEGRTGTTTKANVRADVFEAVVGAIYLDGGLAAAKAAVVPLFGAPPADAGGAKSPKSALMEWAQARRLAGPVYELVSERGPPHEKCFEMVVIVAGQRFGPGVGSSKQAAEIEVARIALAAQKP